MGKTLEICGVDDTELDGLIVCPSIRQLPTFLIYEYIGSAFSASDMISKIYLLFHSGLQQPFLPESYRFLIL